MTRDEAFRRWYDAREGTKSESFAYDVWCAAWAVSRMCGDADNLASDPAGLKTRGVRAIDTPCKCINIEECNLHDKCMKKERE